MPAQGDNSFRTRAISKERACVKKLFPLLLIPAVLTGCAAEPTTVRIATHDSFAISDELITSFEESSGLELEIIRMGDTGTLTNQLVLSKDEPIADAFFGIDNTFRGVAEENEIVDGEFTAIDFSDVCFNYDRYYFEDAGITPPSSWKELTDETYRGLTVITNPQSSSPGLAFLASTVAALDDYESYWQELKANDVLVTSGWEDAYFTEFSGSSGEGDYPIVLSYASSPSAEVRDNGESQTAALLDDCFRQTEFAGVLAGADNPGGAQELIDFMLSDEFQSAVPELMYVYPVTDVELPQSWAEFASPANSTVDLPDLNDRRDEILGTWEAIFE